MGRKISEPGMESAPLQYIRHPSGPYLLDSGALRGELIGQLPSSSTFAGVRRARAAHLSQDHFLRAISDGAKKCLLPTDARAYSTSNGLVGSPQPLTTWLIERIDFS